MQKLIIAVLLLMSPIVAIAEGGRWYSNADGVVLGGHDVVAYFSADAPVQGSADYQARHDGVTFYFSNADNLAAFRAEPEKYLPKYGGFCAFGMAMKNAKVPTDPETFKIYNGELLLFFNDEYEGKQVNTKIMWNADEAELFAKAEQNWRSQS